MIGTAQLNDVEPYAYLRAVLERIADHPINQIDELLPWRLDLINAAKGGVSDGDHPHIEALIKRNGHIMIGAIQPVRNAAVAYDGKQAVAMLRYEANEFLNSILNRLDTAIVATQASGVRVGEWNQPGAKWT